MVLGPNKVGSKKSLGPNNTWVKKIWVRKIWGGISRLEHVWVDKIMGSKKIMGKNKFQEEENSSLATNLILLKTILGTKNWSKQILFSLA